MSVQQTVPEHTQRESTQAKSSEDDRRRTAPPPPDTPQAPGQGGGGLSRVTANFTPRAMASLERVCDKQGDSRTDVLNMAVQMMETVLDIIERGDGRSLRVLVNDEVEVYRFIG